MAKRTKESFQKRAREKARQEKQAEKRAKRQSSSTPPADDVSRAEEDALMEQFALLSERFEADEISLQSFNAERERIFGELGLGTD